MPYLLILSLLLQTLFSLSAKAEGLNTDVLVVGGSQSGVAAAVQAARMGSKVILVSYGDWLGGSLVEAGVSAVDGSELDAFRTGIWGEFISRLSKSNPYLSKYGWVSLYTFDPRYGRDIFREMVDSEANITLLTRYEPHSVMFDSSERFKRVTGVKFDRGLSIKAKVTIDATELGDLLELGDIPYRVGWEYHEEFKEPSAPKTWSKLTRTYEAQSPTWVFYLKDFGKVGKDGIQAPRVPLPSGYSYKAASRKFWCAFKNERLLKEGSSRAREAWKKRYTAEEKRGRVFSAESFLGYGQVSPEFFMINWPRCGNDYGLKVERMYSKDPLERKNFNREARAHSLWFARYLQDTLGRRFGLAEEIFAARPANGQIAGMAYIPYYREARRLVGYTTFSERMFLPNLSKGENSTFLADSIAIGNYVNDHHYPGFQDEGRKLPLAPKAIPWGGRTTGTPFAIPYHALLPIQINGLLVTEKSWSVSHIANGVSRLQPACIQIGQASGAAASIAASKNIVPFDVKVSEIQEALLLDGRAPATLVPLFDLPVGQKAFQTGQRMILAGQVEFPVSGYLRQAGQAEYQSPETEPLEGFEMHNLEFYCGTLVSNHPKNNSYTLKDLQGKDGQPVIRQTLSGENRASSASVITTSSHVYDYLRSLGDKSARVCLRGVYNHTANWILAYQLK